MNLLLNALVTGVAVGSVYGLIALGYSVVYSATHVFNLAQGNLVMAGVLLSYYTLVVLHWPQPVAFLLVAGGICALSLIEERTVVRPLLERNSAGHNIGWFISTLAFGLVIETVAAVLYGDHPPLAVPSFLPASPIRLGEVSTTPQLALAVAALIVATFAIESFYRRSWLGQAMRGAAHDREVAALRGISPARVSRLAFLLGGFAAAVTGFVLAPIVFSDVTLGLSYSIKGFVALAIGGFGSIRGTLAGALVLGIGEQLFDVYVNPRYEILAALLLLLLVLGIRPNGILGARRARTV
ncbi:branched-chain amino acid ABC transporter permease [Amycolatopsis rubida]|uniref:Branched-chain amino acid transport system permease protein n=1 Tax=Amycolatopsis rubida TaxID=112413 RepID=A0A1I5SGC5_9PSEU|nr:branched-chain amino acid ABC transporter permease [Amycolatopsis rubida]SFP69761.1 branched-chain amino acid transport system permease protein [Amycolatopsis rubida]